MSYIRNIVKNMATDDLYVDDLIKILIEVRDNHGNIEVAAQSHGCCQHPHDVSNVVIYEELGEDYKTLVLEV